jgi:hypothetical protein
MKTCQLLSMFGVLLVLVFVATLSPAQQKISTVHGELVEVTSFVKEGIKPTSPAGKEIAKANLGKGGALAILDKGTNKLYLIAALPSDTTYLPRIIGYLGGNVYVKGPIMTRSGIRLITVEDIGKSLK